VILVFLGPPGSGKGTQAKLLAKKVNLPHISLGDMLRQEVRLGSDIGKKAEALINAGNLVPDELTIALTRKRIVGEDCKGGFILDGFPRSDAQAKALDKMFAEEGIEQFKVIYFEVSQDEVVERLCGRRSCRSCGAVYHVKFNPPKVEGKCDHCKGELYLRQDDEENAIRTRFEVYAKQTKPIIERYAKAGKLGTIAASGKIEEVFKALLRAIGYDEN